MNNPDKKPKHSKMKEEYESLLELVNSNEYQELLKYYQSETFMDIAGISRRENSHSSFLAWLLDPSKSHGLGTFALEKLLETIMLAYTDSWFSKQFDGELKNELGSTVSFFHPANEKWHSAIRSFCVAIDRVEVKREWTGWKPDDEKNAARLDIWLCTKIRDKREANTPPINLWIAIENKVGSIENEYEIANEDGEAQKKATKKFQTQLYWDLLRPLGSPLKNQGDDATPTLIMPVFLSPVPQSDYKEYLHKEYVPGKSKEHFEGIARSNYFFTLNYQYLLDGVLELAQKKTSNSFSAALVESYIHCLGRAIDASDDSEKSSKDRGAGYLVLATGKREKRLVLQLWEQNRVVLTHLLKAGLNPDGATKEKTTEKLDYEGHYNENRLFYQSFFLTLQELEIEKKRKENRPICDADNTQKDESELLRQYALKLRTKNKQPEFHFFEPQAGGTQIEKIYRSGQRKPKSLGWLAHELIRVWCEKNKIQGKTHIDSMRRQLLEKLNPNKKANLWIGMVCVSRSELETQWKNYLEGKIPVEERELWTASHYFLDNDMVVDGKKADLTQDDYKKLNMYNGTMALDTKDYGNHISVNDDPQDDLFVAHWWSEQNILDLLNTPDFRSFYQYNHVTREIRLI